MAREQHGLPRGDVRSSSGNARRRVGVGTALVAGFGLLVVLWLAAVVDLAFRVRDANRELDEMTHRFFSTDEALQSIRGSVLLAAIDWRDAFLDTDASRISTYRRLIVDHRQECTHALGTLRGSGEAWLVTDVAKLEHEVDAYWAGVVPLVEMAPLRQAVEARRILNERVIPKRAQVIGIVQHVQQLNRAKFQRQQRDVGAVYMAAQSRLVWTGGLATLLSVVIGAVVFVHVSRLQARLSRQLAANEDITAALHRLSARIVSAQEDERRHIARELHDEIGQVLTAVKLQLSLVGRAIPAEHRPSIDEARSVVDSALQSTRSLSRLLHPPMLDDIGLAAAVEWYLKEFARRTNIEVSFEHSGLDRRASREIETCVYRVVQEATTNIARHAEASTCRVYLQRLPASVVLTVEDDGRGFDATEPTAGTATGEGLGLLGMRERVEGFRGTFRLEGGEGRGTRITVEVPAGAPDAGAAHIDSEEEPNDGENSVGR